MTISDSAQADRCTAVSSAAIPDGIQPAGFLLQLSLDWIVLRASENVDRLLGESHVTLIDEPLSRFVQAQALHDLRNLFSRLSGSTGIARAYRVRLTDDRPRFDVAFQVHDRKVLLEAVPSPQHGFGEAIGSVGGLIDGLRDIRGAALLESAARRMRALAGFDHVTIDWCGRSASSSRGRTGSGIVKSIGTAICPDIIADVDDAPVPVFPRKPGDESIACALLRSPPAELREQLRAARFLAAMRIPIRSDDRAAGAFLCAHRQPWEPSFEIHAAAELFAQMFVMRMEIERLGTPDVAV